ncbi:unannotated protein [freshwater metagenome]|uniref:Unannotated protein n=1 Tax=freshwater metagenome TaxID=449393 RepID=A0A6J7QQH1_9ZZZZ
MTKFTRHFKFNLSAFITLLDLAMGAGALPALAT